MTGTTVDDRGLWLRDVPEPFNLTEAQDPYASGVPYRYGPELDTAIAALRQTNPVVDAAFTLAEAGGLPLVPVRTPGQRHNPLVDLSRNGGDEDWVVISTGNGHDSPDISHEDFTAEVVAERLAVCDLETHITPTWVIRITNHA